MIKKYLFKKKITIRMISIIMAFIFAAAPVAALADDDKDYTIESHVKHTDKKFSEFELEDLSEEEFDKIYSDLPDFVDDTSRGDDVLQVIIDMETYVNHFSANYSLANLYTSLDVNDQKAEDDFKKIKEEYINVADKIMVEYNYIANSANSDILKERVDDEDDWQDILDYVPLTDEEKKLEKQITDLELKYDEESNKEFKTEIDGTEYTIDELNEAMGDYSLDYDAGMKGMAEIFKDKNKTLGDIYIEMVQLRQKLAQSRGYDNFADYAYKESYDRKYTPEDLNDFREGVKNYFSPLLNDIYAEYSANSAEVGEMMEHKISSEECLDNLESHLDDISPKMHESFDYMIDHDLVNIEVDEKKSNGGFTTTITGDYNCQFLFNDASGTLTDQITAVHEFGHYNQGYFASEDEYFYNKTELDLCEIHSQGLELLYSEYYPEFFGEYADEVTLYNTLNTVYGTVEGCKEDAFQIAVYNEDPDKLTLQKLNELYYDCCEEYDDLSLYNSYYLGMYGYIPENNILEWVDIPHTFSSPLYYISYAISGVAVDELRLLIDEDRDSAIDTYLKLVCIGSDEDFEEALDEVGLNNPITNPRFEEYASSIYDSLDIKNRFSDEIEDDDFEPDEDETEIIDPDDEEDDDKKDDDSSKHKNKSTKDDDNDEKTGTFSEKLPIILIVLILAVVCVVVFIIVALKSSKKNENKSQMGMVNGQMNNMNPYGNPNMPNGQMNNMSPYGNPNMPNGQMNNMSPYGNPNMSNGQMNNMSSYGNSNMSNGQMNKMNPYGNPNMPNGQMNNMNSYGNPNMPNGQNNMNPYGNLSMSNGQSNNMNSYGNPNIPNGQMNNMQNGFSNEINLNIPNGLENTADTLNQTNGNKTVDEMLGTDPADFDGPQFNGNISPYSK